MIGPMGAAASQITSGLLGIGFILDFASAGMAMARASWATQRSIAVGCSRALNPRPCRRRAQPVSRATAHANTIPRKNQRTASLYYPRQCDPEPPSSEMKLAILLLICMLLPVFPQESPRATIRVEVKTDAGPVAGAVVTVNGISLQTDQNGIATTTLPLGKAEVSVSKEGFLPAKASLPVDEAREWQITLELKPEQHAEEEVTVHATRTDTRLQDLPTRVEVLGPEEIDEKTMMTPGDIVMMLNEMGGLRVQSTSPSLGAASVRIQGMRGRYTAFLGDGLPLFGQQGGGLGLLQIPPVDLGQVEVIKGVASALYGAGAMAGVVNLISRRPSAGARA